MTNWSDPKEIAKDYDVFVKVVFSLFGLYVWELFTTCTFEWSLITKRRNFRWPLVCPHPPFNLHHHELTGAWHSTETFTVFFFFCRYCMLFALIGLIISLTVTTRINCGALYTFNSWTGNMTILCASTSLMLRTLALWERKRPIVIGLGTLCLAHWGLLYRTMFIVKAEWSDLGQACVVTQTSPKLLNSTFFFTMAFDLTITLFTAIALLKKHSARTDLWKLLFQDGLIYFLVSFCMNSIPAVLNILNLNTPMNVIATIPAATITAIAACRAVIRLLDFHYGEAYIHSVTGVSSGNPRQGALSVAKGQKYSRRPEIHVTTEHITMAEFSPATTDSPYSKDMRESTIELPPLRKDSEGNSLDENEKKDAFSYPSAV